MSEYVSSSLVDPAVAGDRKQIKHFWPRRVKFIAIPWLPLADELGLNKRGSPLVRFASGTGSLSLVWFAFLVAHLKPMDYWPGLGANHSDTPRYRADLE